MQRIYWIFVDVSFTHNYDSSIELRKVSREDILLFTVILYT